MILLVGHRGVGKTSLLKRFIAARPQWRGFDLDAEIARRAGRPVAELLAAGGGIGEAGFRRLERETLRALADKADERTVIAIGAGCEGPFPEGARVIWIRRVSDEAGRVFTDRPRLDANEVSPLEEYSRRRPGREARFRHWAGEELVLPEGEDLDLTGFIDRSWPPAGALPFDMTLLPENFQHDVTDFFSRRRAWGVRRFEIRDDLLSSAEMERARRELTEPARVLYSSRRSDHAAPVWAGCWDWALELGAPPPSGSGRIPDIVSLHRRSARADLGTALSELEKGGGGAILKLAVEIHDFAELKRGHGWWQADPKRRAFLPRSADGRWRWYRSLFGARMPLHFVREGDGSGADQPFLWQAVLQPPFTRAFAAVLGRPVRQSFSPAEHHAFFAARGMPFVAIDLGAEELAPAFGFLRELGLSHAAVTSPLKAEAAGLADDLSEAARELGAANTLYLSGGGKVYADNTDVTALRALAAERPDGPVWLWGGGGVKPAVLAAWPGARAIPARQGCASGEAAPAVLIWAAPRGREFKWPPADLRPGLVLDLNYTGDSPGREWAVERGVPYQSGLKMFKLQAEAQRAFWRARDGI